MARPWKYDKLIRDLKDDELYHTAKVITFGEKQGFFENSIDNDARQLSEAQKKDVMKNARSSLAHFVAKRLPEEPDGYVEAVGRSRAKYPAWFGKTWKNCFEERI